jgi:hypothetical protein
VILDGARWECPQCRRYSHTDLGVRQTACAHCGCPLDVLAPLECWGTLLKAKRQDLADDICRATALLPTDDESPELRFLAVATGGNLLSRGKS